MIRIFIGYDPREAVAFHTLTQSLLARSSSPLSITPLALPNLSGIISRPRHPLQSTEFAFSRFLTPWLCGYEGWAVYMDCDMLVLDDIAKLWACRDPRYAVLVVKHQHTVTEPSKFLGAPQTAYEKKNWSSVMLFNNALCERLTPEYVDTASGLELHQFKWLADEGLVGDLPGRWNHLVGHAPPSAEVAIAHFTEGGPWFEPRQQCDFSVEWFLEKQRMAHADQDFSR